METHQAISRPAVCPACGADFSGARSGCWLCGWKADDPLDPANRAPFKWTFSLNSLFLWIALLAVLMGFAKLSLEIGIALAIVFIPAAVNTAGMAGYRQRKLGRTMTVPEKLGAFALSVGAFIFIAAIIVCASVCTVFVGEAASHMPDGTAGVCCILFELAFLAGSIAAVLAVGRQVLRGLWKALC